MSHSHTVPLPGGIPADHREHTESTTTILVPNENIAFLNPVQQYNRDLSVAVIRAWNEMRKEEAEAKAKAKAERGGGRKRKGKGKIEAREHAVAEKDEGAADEPEAGPSTLPAPRPRKITILEALSATGLRSIRYAKEIPDVKLVLANDISPTACEAMKRNVLYNGVQEIPKTGPSGRKQERPTEHDATTDAQEMTETETRQPLETEEQAAIGGTTSTASEEEQAAKIGRRPGCSGQVRVNEGDACMLMYSHRAPQSRVDVVDLDPYGTAAPFIDAAINCVADGGLLAVTCTDLAVLAGSQYPEKSFSNYGGVCVQTEYSHEVALRLVLNALATAAARYGRYITPLLSFSIDFYVRLFVRVDTKATDVKRVASQIGTIYTCNYCHSYQLQPFGRVVQKETSKGHVMENYKTASGPPGNGNGCEECGTTLHLGGPMWLGPLQNTAFAHRVLKSIEGQEKDYGTWPRMKGMLTLVSEELPDPFYFTLNKIHGAMHASPNSSQKAVSALLNAGYKVSRSHASSGSIKTDAPRSFVYDLVREYIKTTPVRMDKIAEGSPARRLISKPMTHTVDYTLNPGAKAFDKQDKTVLYQRNPLPNWGPGSRAKNAKAGSVKRNVGEDGVEAGPEPTPTPTVSEVQPSAANGDGSIGEKRKSATLGGAEGSTETAQAGAEAGTEAKRAKVEEKGPVDVAEEEMMNV